MCSVDQNGSSWLEEEARIGNLQRLTCRSKDPREEHQKIHAVISLQEAAEWGVLNVAEGCVLIAIDELLGTLARRIA